MTDISKKTSVSYASVTANTALTVEVGNAHESVMFALVSTGGTDLRSATVTAKHGDDSTAAGHSDATYALVDNKNDLVDQNSVRKIGYIGGRKYVTLTSSVAATLIVIKQRPTVYPVN